MGNSQTISAQILIISFFYAPDARVGAKRFSFLVPHFQKRFSDIHVLTVKEKFIEQEDETIIPAGNVHRAGIFPNFISVKSITGKIFKRLWDNYFCIIDPFSGWIVPAFFKGYNVVKRNNIKVILVTGPPFSSFVAGYFLSLFTGAKLVLDYRDPWSAYIWKNSKIYSKFHSRILENFVVKNSSAIIFCSEIMKKEFLSVFGSKMKNICHVITNGFIPTNKVEPLELCKNKINMVYAGNFYGERRLQLITGCLVQLLKEYIISKNKFCLHVFGKIKDNDKLLIEKLGLQNLIIEHRPVPHDKLVRYLKSADLLLLISGSDVSYALPYKIFDYLSVKKPILAITSNDSAVYHFMYEIDCGQVASIHSEDSILFNFREILKKDVCLLSFEGMKRYEWATIGREYVDIIESVMLN